MTGPVPALLDGRFALGRLLGGGGMADVFCARDLRYDREVAIKILRHEAIETIGAERFRREIAVTAAFSHPHILTLLDSGDTHDAQGHRVLYYAMPLIEGETIRGRLLREGRLPIEDAIQLTREILEAVRYAHAHGVIHRDIKPANVLLSDGHAVVADFGIARPLPGVPDADGAANTLTSTGFAVGTPAYMSPEQAFAEKLIDGRCDLYAVGCVMYEMLAGSPPFDAPSGQAIMARKMSGAFLPLTTIRPGVPLALDAVASRALSADPADRFPSATAFLAALNGSALSQTPSSESAVAPADIVRRRVLGRRRGALAIIGVVAIASAIFANSYLSRARGSASERANLLDPTRVAVLPFENLSPDSALTYIANGLTTDLIDELAQVGALRVISKDGVLASRARAIGVDSLARVLKVGSVVSGDIRRTASGGVSVTVRLIDGQTGTQLASHDTSGTLSELLVVRSGAVAQVVRFLRQRLGEQVRLTTTRRRAKSAEAWQLVERVSELRERELSDSYEMPPAQRRKRFQYADSVLSYASQIDARWSEPETQRGRLANLQAALEEVSAVTGGSDADGGLAAAKRLWREAILHATRALDRDPNDADAFHVRGLALRELWTTAQGDDLDSLRVRAEADLRSAVERRPEMALAWNDLSSLLQMSGEYEQAQLAAENALREDAFLRDAPAVLARLQFAALGAENTASAISWCNEGQRRYPSDPRFYGCALTIEGWTASRPTDVEKAWRLLADAERRDSAQSGQSGWPTRRLLVAAIAARAGLRDSALAIVARTRAHMPGTAPTDFVDYGEAHVQTILGRNEQAIALLQRYLSRFPAARRDVARTPWFKALHSDPRFNALTRLH